MRDEPEEIFMGAGKKTKQDKYEDMIEEHEMENFRRVVRTKKELKKVRESRMDNIHEKLENLDDDFAAIQKIIQRTGGADKRNDDGQIDAA